MIIVPEVEMVLDFKVRGRANANHRPRTAIISGRAVVYKDSGYRAWMKKVRAAADEAIFESEYVMPPKDRRLYLFSQFFLCNRKLTRFKKGARAGNVGYTGLTAPDAGNLNKGIEDALEGIVFHNDRLVTTLPYPGYETFTTMVKSPDDQEVLVGLAYVDDQNKTLKAEIVESRHQMGLML